MPSLNIPFTDEELAELRDAADRSNVSSEKFVHDAVLAAATSRMRQVAEAARRTAEVSAELNRRLASTASATSEQVPDVVEQVNRTQVPTEVHAESGDRAWLVPERLWGKLQDVAYLIHDPEGAREKREALSRQLRAEAKAVRNDPREQAMLRELRRDWYGDLDP